MLKNYFVVAWRTLCRNPTYTAINVGGLALELACCVLIALYVQDELRYDDFHKNGDRLVFVGKESSFGGEVSPWLFVAAGLLAFAVATGATSSQALRAARTSPAQALRSDE